MAMIRVNKDENGKETLQFFNDWREASTPTVQTEYHIPYTGLQGVSADTKPKLGDAQKGYKPSDTVTKAQQRLQQIQGQKPQGYSSKYQGQLDDILNQLQNQKDFKYEFNGDNLFKAYADMYTQMGKQASLDAMGQAAGMTGGYGNSYGQMVGQQQYQQNLIPLYDRGMQLAQMAYGRYQDQQQALKDRYGLLQGADETAYGRYRDTMSDWQLEESQAAERELQEREMDYDQYQDMLKYWTGLAQVENAAYVSEQERQEAIRQYEQDFAESKRRYDLDYEEDKRRYDTEAKLNQDKFDEEKRAALVKEKLNQDIFDEDKRAASVAEKLEQDKFDEYKRAALIAEKLDQDKFDESVRQYDADAAYRDRVQTYNETADDRDYKYKVERDKVDDAYRDRVQTYNEKASDREFDEGVRQFDINALLERDKFNLDKDQFEEYKRQAQVSEKLDQDKFDESVRQYDADAAYRDRVQTYNETADDRDYKYKVERDTADDLYRDRVQTYNETADDRDYKYKAEQDAKQYYYKTALDILANGEMPTDSLLKLADISKEDATKLMAKLTETGNGNGNTKKEEKTEKEPETKSENKVLFNEPMKQVQTEILNNMPELSATTLNTNLKDQTVGDVKNQLDTQFENYQKQANEAKNQPNQNYAQTSIPKPEVPTPTGKTGGDSDQEKAEKEALKHEIAQLKTKNFQMPNGWQDYSIEGLQGLKRTLTNERKGEIIRAIMDLGFPSKDEWYNYDLDQLENLYRDYQSKQKTGTTGNIPMPANVAEPKPATTVATNPNASIGQVIVTPITKEVTKPAAVVNPNPPAQTAQTTTNNNTVTTKQQTTYTADDYAKQAKENSNSKTGTGTTMTAEEKEQLKTTKKAIKNLEVDSKDLPDGWENYSLKDMQSLQTKLEKQVKKTLKSEIKDLTTDSSSLPEGWKDYGVDDLKKLKNTLTKEAKKTLKKQIKNLGVSLPDGWEDYDLTQLQELYAKSRVKADKVAAAAKSK